MRLEMPQYTEEEFQESLKRAIKLANTPNGSGHQNFLKGIRVSFDIKYPCYITPELQRYNWIDIVTSQSKMHRLLQMDLDKACNKYVSQQTINHLQELINDYNKIQTLNTSRGWIHLRNGEVISSFTKKEQLYHKWMQIISDCPQGLELFMRVSTNYLQLKTIYHQRKNHKLHEDWVLGFCQDFVSKLPYAKEFIIGDKKDE
jgi:hypothetical protein